LKSEQNRQTE
jgi:chromosome segregation ATPase